MLKINCNCIAINTHDNEYVGSQILKFDIIVTIIISLTLSTRVYGIGSGLGIHRGRGGQVWPEIYFVNIKMAHYQAILTKGVKRISKLFQHRHLPHSALEQGGALPSKPGR